MNVDIQYNGKLILINYQYKQNEYNTSWIDEKVKNNGFVSILDKGCHFYADDILSRSSDSSGHEVKFIVAKLNGEYFEIQKHVFNTNNNILIHKDKKIAKKYFRIIIEKRLFRSLEEIVQSRVVIGGTKEGAIPFDDFIKIVQTLPTKTQFYDL